MLSGVLGGVLFHWLGGLASGSFYVPYKAVKKWSWEVYWLAGGFFSWIIAPWVMACLLTNDLIPVLREGFAANPKACFLGYLFGMLWGIGGLTFGLTLRYLGMSLGMAVALGICTVMGTLIPDVYARTIIENIQSQPPYCVILLGLGVCLLGVIIAGFAGMSKEREMPAEEKKAAVKEFNFTKGILIALVSGFFSACMAFGIQAMEPVAEITAEHGTGALWVGLPKLCVILLGGFTTNFLWCLYLMLKNKTLYQFGTTTIQDPDQPGQTVKVNYLSNLFFSALAGTTWYFQFFFYSMGETRMGEYKFSSWTLHMASIIIFSSLWGLVLHEWKGSSRFTKALLGIAIGTLLYSTIVVGYGNLMKEISAEPAAAVAVEAVEGDAAAQAVTEAVEEVNASLDALIEEGAAIEEQVEETVEEVLEQTN